MLEKIIQDLGRLRDELKSSRNPAIEYIRFLLFSISISQEKCSKERCKALRIIESGSKIVEYADFNDVQKLFGLKYGATLKTYLKNTIVNKVCSHIKKENFGRESQ